jgi:hypothetical protein
MQRPWSATVAGGCSLIAYSAQFLLRCNARWAGHCEPALSGLKEPNRLHLSNRLFSTEEHPHFFTATSMTPEQA